MSDDPSTSGRQRFLEALHVRRNAVRGFAFGVVATALVYVVFVVMRGLAPVPSLYFIILGVTMALALGGLSTAILVGFRLRGLLKEL